MSAAMQAETNKLAASLRNVLFPLLFFIPYCASWWHMATYLQQEFICRYIKKSTRGQIKLCNKTQPRRNIAGETYGTVKNYHLRRATQNTGKSNSNTLPPK